MDGVVAWKIYNLLWLGYTEQYHDDAVRDDGCC